MVIRILSNPDQQPVERLVAKVYESAMINPPDDLSSQIIQITVSGLPAYETTIPSTNTELTILLPNGDKVYVFALVHGPTVNAVDPEALDLFY